MKNIKDKNIKDKKNIKEIKDIKGEKASLKYQYQPTITNIKEIKSKIYILF